MALEKRQPETTTRLSPRAARRKRRQRKRTGRRALFVVLGVIIVLVLIWSEFIRSTPGPSTDVTKGLVLGPVEAGKYGDDITKGRSKRGFIKVRVQVELMQGKIQKITILSHRRLLWWPKAKGVPEKIAEEITASQSTRVRAISGATITSRATMLAVQDALTNNQKKNKWDVYERTGQGGRWDNKY